MPIVGQRNPLISPKPHEIVKRNDPITSRIWAENFCANGHKKLSPIAQKALAHVAESPGLSQNEHDAKYQGTVDREFTKWFNRLSQEDYIYGYLGKVCSISGAWVLSWYVVGCGPAYKGKA